jgi:hypothetical protein
MESGGASPAADRITIFIGRTADCGCSGRRMGPWAGEQIWYSTVLDWSGFV